MENDSIIKRKQSDSSRRIARGVLDLYVFNAFTKHTINKNKSQYVADAVREALIRDGVIKNNRKC